MPFAIRQATAADIPAVAAMIHARCDWLEQRGLPTWRDSADNLAAQAANPDGQMWILEETAHSCVVGCTTIQDECPPWGWTSEELDQPAHYLYATVTDPTFRADKPGTLIALWATDRAARQGMQWIRRGCMFPELVRYYETQGFALAHEVQRTHNRIYLMQRRAQRVVEQARLPVLSL